VSSIAIPTPAKQPQPDGSILDVGPAFESTAPLLFDAGQPLAEAPISGTNPAPTPWSGGDAKATALALTPLAANLSPTPTAPLLAQRTTRAMPDAHGGTTPRAAVNAGFTTPQAPIAPRATPDTQASDRLTTVDGPTTDPGTSREPDVGKPPADLWAESSTTVGTGVGIVQRLPLGRPLGAVPAVSSRTPPVRPHVSATRSRQSADAVSIVARVVDTLPGDDTTGAVSADAGDAAVAAGVAQRQADGAVVFDGGSDEPPTDVVQRTPSSEAPAVAGASGAPGGVGGADLDELAKRLYGRMRLMLKHELRLDRERAGQLTQRRS
jgi:hypothetical protein